MRDYQSFEVRNVSVIGHSGAGKTSVLEAMLYYTKATDRFGKTTEGSSMIDFDAEEIRRGLSVYTTIVPIEWEDSKINFIDTPGYLDFVGEKQGGFSVGDSSLIVVNAKDPLQSGTKLAYKQAVAEKKPHAVRLFHGDVAVVHDGAGLIAYHTENGLAILRTDGAILHPDVCGAALPQRDEPHRAMIGIQKRSSVIRRKKL